ncbi:MAG: transglutaminase family protein [Actinomycetota bacterium]
MSRFRVVHATVYRYESTVSSSYGQVCLLPRVMDGQLCHTASIAVEPAPADQSERTDFFGNRVGYFHVERPHELLRITARSEVTIDPAVRTLPLPLEGGRPLAAIRAAVDGLTGPEAVEAAQHLHDSPRVAENATVRAYAAKSFRDDRPVVECLNDLVERIHDDFEFKPDATQVTSTIADLFDTGAGVCQDFAHLAVACIRAAGLPGRYVSGYLETEPPPGKPKVKGADVSHAWASAMIPGVGWIDLDPTNRQFVNDRYVTTAWGRDYADVAPVSGVIYSDGGMSEMEVAVDVTRLP